MTSPNQESPDHRDSDFSLSLAAAVHDVNQMLAVITGRAGLLQKQVGEPELSRHLQAILLASADAAAILRRVTARASGLEPNLIGAALHDVAEQARLLVWPAESAAFVWRNTVGPEWQASLPSQVLREVLANLVLNAVEAMADGGQVAITAEAGSAGRVVLWVADTGPGLPGPDLEQVFVRGRSASGRLGRGIGLAGCRELLAGVGATITVDASSAEGTVFALDLPDSPGHAVEPAAKPPEQRADMTGLQVLVVDDDSGVREMLHDVLTEWGCGVQLCRDAQSVLTDYQPGTAAVALVDLNLPGLSGLELATRLRSDDAYLSIVTMTGWQHPCGESSVTPEAVDFSAHKPLELNDIRAVLGEGYQLNKNRRAE